MDDFLDKDRWEDAKIILGVLAMGVLCLVVTICTVTYLVLQ